MENTPDQPFHKGTHWKDLLQQPVQGFQLGSWHVQPESNQICNGFETKKLGRKTMELLVYFAFHSGKVLDKKALMAEVWEHRFVSEMVVTVTVSHLRRALADNARAPLFLATIKNIGYQFLVEPAESESVQPEPVSREARKPKFGFGLVWLFCLSLLLWIGWVNLRQAHTFSKIHDGDLLPGVFTVLVGPTQNLTANPENDRFTKAAREELILGLDQFPHLQIKIQNPADRLPSLEKEARLIEADYFVEVALLSGQPGWRWSLKIIDMDTHRLVHVADCANPSDNLQTYFRTLAAPMPVSQTMIETR